MKAKPENLRAVALVRAGKSFTEAAKIVGTTRSAVAGACQRADVCGQNKGRSRKEWRRVLTSAARRGVYPAELARELGVSRSAVCWAERNLGLFLKRKTYVGFAR